MTEKCPPSTTDQRYSEPKGDQTGRKGITRDELMKKLLNDPRFKEAPKSGQGFVIVGVKR